jgi:hypothetical protein
LEHQKKEIRKNKNKNKNHWILNKTLKQKPISMKTGWIYIFLKN